MSVGNMSRLVKKMSSTLFFGPLKVGKTKHYQKQLERNLGKVLLAYDKAELWSSSGQIERGGYSGAVVRNGAQMAFK